MTILMNIYLIIKNISCPNLTGVLYIPAELKRKLPKVYFKFTEIIKKNIVMTF
jgi:hypothetical protein